MQHLWPLAAVGASAADQHIEHVVYQFAWLLLAAALLGVLSWRLNVPYAVVLVVGGILLSASGWISLPALTPNVVLFVFLPPLLFDAAFRLDVSVMRVAWRPILLLAVPGVLATAGIVGGALALAGTVGLGAALLFGAIVAATDPVAVISVFSRLRVSHRLATIAEAESLINDGMAITLFTALSAYAVSGVFDVQDTFQIFTRQVGLGLLVGLACGFVVAWLGRPVEDHLVEMALSAALAYGSYLVAHSLDASGPLACVAAGLLHGSYGRTIGMSTAARRLLDDLWEYLGFAANGFVFLLVGVSVELDSLRQHAGPIAIAIVAVVLSRFAVIEGSHWVVPRRQQLVGAGERRVLAWGGLRGALTIALALAMPLDVPARATLLAMAYGVVLFTLLVQTLTLPLVIRRANVGA